MANGIGFFALIRLFFLGKAIRDEKALKELYNKEHDERLREIRAKAGMPILLITSVLMLIAALIAGPLSVPIFYTLLIASSAQLLISLGVKMYYLKKM
jgi:Na+/H+ antiporter NhaD/arsenite permease-like protein